MRLVEVEDLDSTILHRLDMLAFRPQRVLTIVLQDTHQIVVSVEDLGIPEPLSADLARAILTAPTVSGWSSSVRSS